MLARPGLSAPRPHLLGVSDRDTWQRSYYQRADYPLLFDDNYQPKPAFCLLAHP